LLNLELPDLGGEEESIAEVEPLAAPSEAEENALMLDFGDLGGEDATASPVLDLGDETPAEDSAAGLALDLGDAAGAAEEDELGLSDLGGEETFDLGGDGAEGGELSLDLPELEGGDEAEGAFDLSLPAGDDEGLDLPDLAVELSELAAEGEPDLGLPDLEQTLILGSPLDQAAPAEPEPAGLEDVDNKLDLARAFIGMGDAEGARALLEEVQAEGNEVQRRQAQEMLGELS